MRNRANLFNRIELSFIITQGEIEVFSMTCVVILLMFSCAALLFVVMLY